MSGAVARARALLQRLGPNATVADVDAARGEVGAMAAAVAIDALRAHGRGASGALARAEDWGGSTSARDEESEPTAPGGTPTPLDATLALEWEETTVPELAPGGEEAEACAQSFAAAR